MAFLLVTLTAALFVLPLAIARARRIRGGSSS